jgi:ABC-type lipoprotein release transport system permease subunit
VIALFSASNVLRAQIREDVQTDKIAMIDLAVNLPEGAEAENDLYLATLNRQNAEGQALPALEGIQVVEAWAYYFIQMKAPGQENYSRAELRAHYGQMGEQTLEPYRLLEGRLPTSGQNEVAVEIRMAEALGLQIGDSLRFRSTGAQGEVAYTLVGLVFHPYSASNLAGDIPGPELGVYLNYADLQSLLGGVGVNRFVARYESFEQAEAQFEAFIATVAQVSPYLPAAPDIEDPDNSLIVQNTAVYISILSSLALSTMIVSSFLVVNVINTITAEQKQQIGILKSIGASQAEVFGIYAGMAAIYGLIGTALAILPGILLGQWITAFLGTQIDIRVTGFAFSPTALALGVVLGLFVPVLAVLIPVYNASRISILEAIQDLGISSNYGQGRAARFLGGLPLPISLRQALSNVYQKQGRLLLTGLTLTATIGTFMGTYSLTVSVSNEIRDIFGRITYHILVIPYEIQDPRLLAPQLEAMENVESVHIGTVLFIQLEGDYINFFTNDNQVQVFGFDPADPLIRLDYLEGEGWSNDPTREGMVISQPIAKQLNLSAGDEIRFGVAGQSYTTQVIGIDRNAFDIVNMRWDQLSRAAGIEFGGQALPSAYYITLEGEGWTTERIAEQIELMQGQVLAGGISAGYFNQQEETEIAVAAVESNTAIFLVASLLIAAVGAVGLLTTLTISVFERQKEIGVMRSIGADSASIAWLFILEGLVVGFLAWLLGVPLGYGIALIFNQVANLENVPFTYPPSVLILGLVGMMAIAALASLGPSLSAARKTVSEILRYQ